MERTEVVTCSMGAPWSKTIKGASLCGKGIEQRLFSASRHAAAAAVSR